MLQQSCQPKISLKAIAELNQSDASSLFAELSNSAWAFWLDSGNSAHVDANQDILVWQPCISLSYHNQQHQIEFDANTAKFELAESNQDPLSLLQQILTQFSEQYAWPVLPKSFNGGCVGYFSYDLGRSFEQLPQIAQDDIQMPEMAVGFYNKALIIDKHSGQVCLLAPEHEFDYWQQYFVKQAQQRQLNTEFSLNSTWQANMSQAEYADKFAQVKAYLFAGDCYQINLAQRFQAKYQGDEFNAYLKLRAENNAPFSAFMRFNDFSVLSVSPERFLQVQHNKVQTKPIKGTRPRSTDPIKDQALANELQTATKDNAENLMIVDLLRNDLSRVCKPGSVTVPKLFAIESFAAVHHLVSTVEGELLPEYHASDLLRASFPGGSITGAPKIRAMEIIEQLEPHRRNIYCGAIGYLAVNGNMDTSITIRTLVAKNQQFYCWAGGGLVADSVLEQEYQETFDKVSKILPILG